MSDSKDDKSPKRRDKTPEKPSEESKSSNKPVEADPADIPPDSTTKPEEQGASGNKPLDRLSVAPPGSYGGARPKVYAQKKEERTKKSSDTPVESNLRRATEVLEATVSRRRELFRRRREEAKEAEEPVSRYLGPDWIDAAANERPRSVSPATRRLRTLAQNILNSEYHRRCGERREDFKPWISSGSGHSEASAKQTLSDKPVKGKFEDDFKSESDSDDPPRLRVKLPDLSKKSSEPPPKPKDKGKSVEEPSPTVEQQDRYHVESISRYMFLDRPPFVRPEFDADVAALIAYYWLDAIYVQHGIQDWRRFTLAAYQAGRYHTEQQLRAAREQMEELNVTEEEYLEMYHIVRRDYQIDEGCCDEYSDLVEKILALLELMELLTSAMLYMDMWQNRNQREETEQRGRVRRLLRATIDDEAAAEYLPPSLADEDEQRTDPSTSPESSADRSDSAIVTDYPSKSEEKTPPFFYESMREYVSLELDYRPRHLTLETRPPSVLSSSDISSIPLPPSPVEIASPSPEGIASPEDSSPNSEEVEMDAKMQGCVLVPVQEVPVACSNLSSSKKSLKLSDTSPLSPIKVRRIAQLQEIDSSDSTSENVSPLPVDSPDVPELEEDSFEVNAEWFQIVPHIFAMSILEGVMNEARDELIALFPGNKDVESVAEQKSESSEIQSTDSNGKRKVHQTDSDEESGKKMAKKRHME